MPEPSTEVTWASLPNKGQLATVVFARFCEPFVRTSISTYVYYQLQSLDPSKPSDVIVREAALLQTVFTLAQGCTAVLWGTLADWPRGGRKLVLLISLGGSLLSTLAFGFISDYRQAVAIRLIEGAVNGNTAVIRTMVSEIVKERRFQAKAFVLMPMCYNISAIISPLIAGLLADLAGQYPNTLGQIWFFRRFPYVPPAAVSASVSLIAWLLVFFNLKETHPLASRKFDLGLAIKDQVKSVLSHLFKRLTSNEGYSQLASDSPEDEERASLLGSPEDVAIVPSSPVAQPPVNPKQEKQVLPLRRMFTRNLLLTLLAHGIQEGHVSAWNTLMPSFLSFPVTPDRDLHLRLPFFFTGGLGLPAKQIAITLAFMGILGIPLQLGVYASVTRSLGLLRTWRIFMRGFPIVYFVIPYLSIVPSSTPRPEPRSGAMVWIAIFFAQLLMIGSTTFVVPSQIVLTNNASPHPTALGRTHSAAEMVCSFTRTISPFVAGLFFAYGSTHGIVGLPWWIMSVITVLACVLSFYVNEGDGHEIKLDGDDEDQVP
ncbi:MFS general substrate transporter [Xylariaceae sp. FL0255]|nr:MFS general substrate transporter [Xylariaceae sp. FL0255]